MQKRDMILIGVVIIIGIIAIILYNNVIVENRYCNIYNTTYVMEHSHIAELDDYNNGFTNYSCRMLGFLDCHKHRVMNKEISEKHNHVHELDTLLEECNNE